MLRKLGRWTDFSSGPETLDGLRKFVLAEKPRRDISPIKGMDTFDILDDGTIIRSIEQL